MSRAVACLCIKSATAASASLGRASPASRRSAFQRGKKIDLALQLLPFSLDLAG
jgi:hypothetical protein